MSIYEHILDNRDRTVADYLRKQLSHADVFLLVSAYFSIYGYEQLEREIERVREVRFLFGDPASVDRLDPSEKDPQFFEITEAGLSPSNVLRQKGLARRCAEWVQRQEVEVRSVTESGLLHGKMYLTDDTAEGGSAVVGSSNFTRSGLGGGKRPNLEINLASTDDEARRELRTWFDDLWADEELTEDAKQQVLTALGRLGKEHSPELIYFKTLFEIFREEINARLDSNQRLADLHLHDTEVWKALYEFQKDGARSVIAGLQRYNGCILADSVGLGKTYTALAVIKYYELRNERVLVLCPRKLRDNWSLYPIHNNQQDNPFLNDRFSYTLLSHTDLSRERGMAGSVDLSRFNWSSFDLLVIDESHNFRNHTGQRYQRLLDEIIEQGAQTKVLMLSATPVNTSLIDLRNQIYLMTAGRADTFRESLGLSDLSALLTTAQREFKGWEKEQAGRQRRDKSRLLEKLGADFVRLLDAVSIARSRRQIEQFYAQEMDLIGHFPNHEKPDNRYPQTDLQGQLSYQELADQIGKFELSIYRPTDYLVDENRRKELEEEREQRNFNQQDRERWLIAMMRTNFLKRLESSPHSLTLTLERTVGKIDALVERIERYRSDQPTGSEVVDVLPDEDEDDEEFFVNRARNPYHLRQLDLDKWQEDMRRDRATLDSAREQVAAITPDRDGKLLEIKRVIREKVRQPTTDLEGSTNRKILVFTSFKDTAEYLYENLADFCASLGINMAMVSGDATRTQLGANNFNAILTRFAPRARIRPSSDDSEEIDLLIGTDCISEGQNLQDCDTTLNYDIHWNPVRLIQRLGRIDRIGSRNKSIRMVNFWPTEDMDAYLNLENRVYARMALADMAATGDGDPLTEEGVQLEMTFRDEQLARLREEILDIDELDEIPTMSDFTLDYFFAQLLRYLEENRDILERTPYGAYALTEPAGPSSGPGVIFVLRHRNGSIKSGQRVASPVHPFYLVYIRDDGRVRFGCANTRQVLEVFEATTIGKSEAILQLCDSFNAETEDGTKMERYEKLLSTVVAHVIRAHSTTQASGLGIGSNPEFVLPPASEVPKGLTDFELVTWLVISNPE
ncbi:MAG: helicase-related protein [bacterium]|nr:helicase-related protein [Bacteroidota bacterium]MDE0643182.1 helicase-related protein [bacterium]